MPDQELVATYMDGQVGRRAFIRRLVRSGVSLAAAVAYSRILQADPAEATHDGAPDLYAEHGLVTVSPSGLVPQDVRVPRGGLVQWDFIGDGTLRKYKLEDPLSFVVFPFLTANTLNRGHQVATFYSAGTFPYRVNVWTRVSGGQYPASPAVFDGQVQVPVRASRIKVDLGDRVTIRWASQIAPPNHVYDVQVNPPGDSGFRMWKSGITEPSAKRKLGKEGKYVFRARLRRLSDGVTSGWSPARVVKAV